MKENSSSSSALWTAWPDAVFAAGEPVASGWPGWCSGPCSRDLVSWVSWPVLACVPEFPELVGPALWENAASLVWALDPLGWALAALPASGVEVLVSWTSPARPVVPAVWSGWCHW